MAEKDHMCFSIQKIYKEPKLNRIMKATRLQQIENRVNRLRQMMSGDSKEFIGTRPENRILGMTRLRRA
ncbi:MAG: hypothetical protein NTY68_02675 [Candidatus Micrarchaeota archaeon]|nr:hypothetical protein [Candidatus Micrarchaeota archaeon]